MTTKRKRRTTKRKTPLPKEIRLTICFTGIVNPKWLAVGLSSIAAGIAAFGYSRGGFQ